MNAPTKKQIAAGQRRRLTVIARKLTNMSEQWCDVDEYNMNILFDLATICNRAARNLYVEEEAE
ncbi:MAG: hypothetical protein LBU53_07565 [Zoogloeaceae bacterium]|jgi:hypothetical protein|nr:hypothetical protein [Zoogloeaceae bacterium]